MKKQELLKRYTDYRTEIMEYMDMLSNELISKYNEIPEAFVISLDLLVFNLDVLFKSVDEIKEKGMHDNDRYRGEKKNAAIQSFFNSQNYINKIIAGFGFTPASKSKIRADADKQDIQKYLEELTK